VNIALLALISAVLLDVVWGDLPNHFHPVVAMGNFIRWMTARFNRGTPMQQFSAGTVAILSGCLLFSIPWLVIIFFLPALPFWLQGILVGVCLKPVFACRRLLEAGRAVQEALHKNNLMEARRLVGWHLVSRDTSQLNSHQVASATIESLAENLTDSFFAPIFYYSIGGLPLAWLYRFVNTADAMIGYRTPQFEYFGKFAARLDDILNWLPARLAGLFLVLAAGLCRLDMPGAWKTMLEQHRHTSSPNAGWTMAAAAGALGVILEKKDHYRLGNGDVMPDFGDIGRATQLVSISLIISLLFCGGIILGSTTLF
jgi:adenosylcobinamide-phosphate synthase